jgi:hypothetical protein
MVAYQFAQHEGKNVCIIKYIDGEFALAIPLNPENSDYANIMQLVAEGKLTIAPAEGA